MRLRSIGAFACALCAMLLVACENPVRQESEGPRSVLRFDGNGNTGGSAPGPRAYDPGDTATASDSLSLVRDYHRFSEWNTLPDGSGTSYAPGDTFAIDGDETILYAQWTPATEFRVIYHGNGNTAGTDPYDPNTYSAGEVFDLLLGDEPVRHGYEIEYWSTEPDGTGDPYHGGNPATMPPHDLILFAQWIPLPTFNVTYHGNGNTGGEPPVDTTDYYPLASVILLGQGSMTRDGYNFAGWSTESNYNGPTYSAGTSLTMPRDPLALYAIWQMLDPPSPHNRVWNGDMSSSGPVSTWWNDLHGTASYDTSIYASGNQSLRLEPDGSHSGNDPIRLSRDADLAELALVPGKTYTFKASLRVSGDQIAYPNPGWLDWDDYAVIVVLLDDWSIHAVEGIQQSDTWITVEVDFIAPDNPDGWISIESRYESTWIDDVVLIEKE